MDPADPTLLGTYGPLLKAGGVVLLAAVLLHLLERATTDVLWAGFGRKSVLFTGWLGVPIHELSHAAMCLVFGHRIVEIRLFQVSADDGTLGYVRHSYPRGKWRPEAGNFFIGVAPLIGGSAALWFLAAAFFPHAVTPLEDGGGLGGTGRAVMAAALSGGGWRPVVFAYVVLCVGAHLSPSPADLRGARKGFLITAFATAAAFGLAATLGYGAEAARWSAHALTPLASLLLFAVLLNAAVHLPLVCVAELSQRARGRTLRPLFARNAPRYLAVAAGVVVIWSAGSRS